MKTLRTQKVGELIKDELGQIMIETLEIPPSIMITITRVDVSPDLNHAKIFIITLPDSKRGTAVEYLNKNAGQLRTALANTISLRNTPQLRFFLDEKEIYGTEIDKLLSEIRKDDSQR